MLLVGTLVEIIIYNSISSNGDALLNQLLSRANSVPRSRLRTTQFAHQPNSAVPLNRVSCDLIASNLRTRHRRNVAVSITCHRLVLPDQHHTVLTSTPNRRRCAHGVTITTSATSIKVLLVSTVHNAGQRARHRLAIYKLVNIQRIILTIGGLSNIKCSRNVCGRLITRISSATHHVRVRSIVPIPISTLINSGILTRSPGAP